MKSLAAAGLLLAALAPAQAATLRASPVTKVVTLLQELHTKVVADGHEEQKSYDKFACWCEETMARKASDISREKDIISKAQTLIQKLKGELAVHKASIAQLQNDIKANLDAQKEATDVRNKENQEYNAAKTEFEQSIGALGSAMTVLTGAGGKKGGFLSTMQQAQLISAAADVRRVLRSPAVAAWSVGKDLQALHHFLEKPEDFAAQRGSFAGAQTGNNPFGDYAPQSTKIQGILSGMHEAFTADLAKITEKETKQQAAFAELMATKKSEQATLEATLQKQEADKAAKSKRLADTKTTNDDTSAQLAADEQLFADTKSSCKSKARDWAERTRLRTEELQSFDTAVKILSSPEAQATFASADSTLLQVSAVTVGQRQKAAAAIRDRAYAALREVAPKDGGDLGLAQLATLIKMGGHFDKIMVMIDHMVEVVRKEEADDIAHRDRCQKGSNANANEIEDLESEVAKTADEIARLNDRVSQTREKIEQLETDITNTKNDMAARLALRNSEHAAFEQALKDDADSIKLLRQAIQTLTAFYEKNKLKPAMLQKAGKEPSYTVDPDKAPETAWKSGSYGGSEQSTNILAIMEMIVEDLEKEMKTSRQSEEAAQKEYKADVAAMTATLNTQEESKVAAEKELASLQAKVVDREAYKGAKTADLGAQESLKGTLATDCAWVETHFDTRREQRKAELQGLADAKAILAGANVGDYNELALSEGSD